MKFWNHGRRASKLIAMRTWRVYRLPPGTDRGGRKSRPGRRRDGQDPAAPTQACQRAMANAEKAKKEIADAGGIREIFRAMRMHAWSREPGWDLPGNAAARRKSRNKAKSLRKARRRGN